MAKKKPLEAPPPKAVRPEVRYVYDGTPHATLREAEEDRIYSEFYEAFFSEYKFNEDNHDHVYGYGSAGREAEYAYDDAMRLVHKFLARNHKELKPLLEILEQESRRCNSTD